MWYRAVRDCIFRNSFAKKGDKFSVQDGEVVPRHLEPIEGEELKAMPDEPPKVEKLDDNLEDLSRAELIDVANAEGVEIPSRARNRGDIINLIRRSRA